MQRSILALLLALPLASAALGADATPVYTDGNGKSWLLDHPTATPIAPIAPPPPAGVFGISATGWDTNFDLGISGTSGNQESFNVHAGLSTLHGDEAGSDKATLSYDHALNEGQVSANRFVADELHNFFNVFDKDSKWGLYANARYEYNDFVEWNHQASAFAGPSYRFLKDDVYTLIGHAGLGGIYKDGGNTDNGHFTPEAQIGADFTWKIDPRQKFEASTNFYPSLENAGDFRNITTAAYNLGIDATKSLRVAAEYDYDSTQTSPFRKGDFKYWISLVVKL